MAWLMEDAADLFELAAGTKQMRDGAKRVKESIRRIRDRHRRDATGPALLREQWVEEEARHVAEEADDIERNGEVIHRMFEGGAA